MRDPLDDLAASRARVVTAGELDAAGLDHNAVMRMRRDGRLIRLYHRTYAVPPVAEGEFALACRGAVAFAGRGAVLIGETALAFGTAYPRPATPEVGVPRARHTRGTPGLTVRRLADEWFVRTIRRAGLVLQHPAPAVVWATGRLARVVDRRAVVCAAVAAGLTAPAEVRGAACGLRVARRCELLDTCDFVAAGCESPAEIEYLVEVERAFGLPAGERQAVIEVPGQRVRRVDVRYGRVVVEIDGANHAAPRQRDADAVRDVVLTALGLHVVRVTASDIAAAPGLVAATVTRALTHHA